MKESQFKRIVAVVIGFDAARFQAKSHLLTSFLESYLGITVVDMVKNCSGQTLPGVRTFTSDTTGEK